MNITDLKNLLNTRALQKCLNAAKTIRYLNRGEPIHYGSHKLRYIPGTRPVRLKYINSPIGIVKNDARQIQFFLDNLHPGDLVLDVGGNVGQYTVLFGSLVAPNGKVVAFEPDPLSKKMLARNVALNGFSDRIQIEELALFDTNGTHSFFSAGGEATASLVAAASGGGKGTSVSGGQEFTVKTMRLDDYLSSKNLKSPDWIKLDAEGAEINILNGARDVLQSQAKIICELHPYAWPSFGTSFEELMSLVEESGRTISYLDSSLKIEDGPSYGATLILPKS